MKWKRMLARTISECVALERAVQGYRPGFRILLYHAVGSRLSQDHYGMSIAPASFERQIAFLSTAPEMVPVGLSEGRTNGSHSALRVAVTFDDGYRDNLYIAAPILLKYRIPFTVFATTSFIRTQSCEYLTPRELRELAGLPGVTIGSHGETHVPLADCDDPTLERELNESRRYLEDVLGGPVTAIAYPHGSVDDRVRDAARRSGYQLGVCSRYGINPVDQDPLLLCRTEVVAQDSVRIFRQKLCGVWDWYGWRSADPADR